jgi:transposase
MSQSPSPAQADENPASPFAHPPPQHRRRKPKLVPMWQRFDRFVGLDIHKAFLTIVILDVAQNIVLSVRKLSWAEFPLWARKNLGRRDAVVLEMTTNSYFVYDLLEPIAGQVRIAHVPSIHAKMDAGAKTDLRDAESLARLLLQGEFEKDKGHVWVLPLPVREIRTLVAIRYDLVGIRTESKNRLHAVLHRHALDRPEGSLPFSDKHAEFWRELPGLSPCQRVEVRTHWNTLRFVEDEITRVEQDVAKVAAQEPAVQLLAQLVGFGLINAVTVIAAIGDIARFSKPGKLVRYAGLDSRVKQSSDSLWTGAISKAGRKDLRSAMVDVATHAAKHHPYWKREFERLSHKGAGVAYCAIARRLLIVVWHLLTDVAADKHGDAQQIADGYYAFYFDLGGKDNLPGAPSAVEYTREKLDELGIGKEVTEIVKNGKTGKRVILPPSEQDPNRVIERKRNTRGGKTEYPPFGCASIRPGPDPRTFEGRLLSGRSKPEGAKEHALSGSEGKRLLACERKKAAISSRTDDPSSEANG